LLALLGISAGRVVTIDAMMEELWGSRPPRSAQTTLQTYIMQLRRKLDQALAPESRSSKDVLVTKRTGYLLDIPPEQIDVHEYDRLALAGGRALDTGDDANASRLLSAALDLWRGPALVDVPVGTQLEIEKVRLEESRLGVLEMRIDADLRLGRHHQLLGELARLSAQHPLHENFHAQYMITLYRSGRQWRALEVYQRLRATVVNDLGVEPSPQVQRLQHAILSGDLLLVDQPARSRTGTVPAAVATTVA
jgi:DNA-binding SARP family transcriptional activator